MKVLCGSFTLTKHLTFQNSTTVLYEIYCLNLFQLFL